MRLIDADALIADIKTKLWDWDTVDGITSSTVLKQTITDIDNTPTIDAVPVIRCKDCKHRDPEDKKCDCGHSILWQLPRDDDWFCADGERKDDES